MKKSSAIFSLFVLTCFLAACGKMPVMKQMNKDAFGNLPETKLSVQEMIAGGAVFSCVKEANFGQVKISYETGKIKLDGMFFLEGDPAEGEIASSTELFDGEKVYIWNDKKALVYSGEDFLASKVGPGNENDKNVISQIVESFERIESPYQCQDEQFEKEYFVPKAGLDFQVATSSAL